MEEQLTILRKLGIENPSESDIPLIPYLMAGLDYEVSRSFYYNGIDVEVIRNAIKMSKLGDTEL